LPYNGRTLKERWGNAKDKNHGESPGAKWSYRSERQSKGNQWCLRFLDDIAGQYARVDRSVRIATAAGPNAVSKTKAKQLGAAFLAEKGINTREHFDRTCMSFKTRSSVITFADRAQFWFGVTEHPTEKWTMQQMREAFPWDEAPRYVLRDRDAIYGRDFSAMTHDLGMEEVLAAPRSPWQNPFAERLVGSIRRECLDHLIVWNERSLRRTLHSYFAYYQRSRTHLALGKDAPEPRAVEPPEQGRVVAIPQVGGLHHRYQRRAA
jgi:hypothetical protein